LAIAYSTSAVSGKFQWTATKSLKPNLSAPCDAFRRPVSFTLASATDPACAPEILTETKAAATAAVRDDTRRKTGGDL
jgi:hypothetical protein